MLFNLFLSDDGLQTGLKSMNVDGSVTPQEFFVAPPPGMVYEIARLRGFIRDDAAVFNAQGFGGLSELTNGVQFTLTQKDTVFPLTIFPIKNNASWERYNLLVKISDFGAGDNFLSWDFDLIGLGESITLKGDDGDRMSVIINDDLTGLVDFTVLALGISLNRSGVSR